MSSLDQDRLLAEGRGPATGSAPTLATDRGTSLRPAAEQATSTVPAQRQGNAQGNAEPAGGTATTRTRRTSATAVARGAGGVLAARARAAGSATRKAATAAKAAAGAKVAARATARSAAKTTPSAPAVPTNNPRPVAAKGGTAKPAAAKTGTAKPASAKAATAKAATAKTGTAKTGTAKTGTAKTGTAKPAAAKTGTAKTGTAKTGTAKTGTAKTGTAKTSTAKPAAAKAETAKAEIATPAAATASTATAGAPRVRPTPHKRTVPAAQILASLAESAAATAPAPVTPATPSTEAPVDVVAGGRAFRFLRRRPPTIARRPSLYLAAALIGALSVSSITTDDPAARATETVSRSVSVAEELGITASPTAAITDTAAAEMLGDLAVSRNVRDAEQAAAAEAQAEADRLAAEAAAEAARPKAVTPVEGARLTSGYGARWGTLHAGIDLAAPMRTPERAVMDGVVLEAGPASGFGLVVYIQHDNGDVTVYGHMDEILVEAGQVVRAGDTIALLGNRGQSTGPHLHFEVHVGGLNGKKIDPLPWLRERGIEI